MRRIVVTGANKGIGFAIVERILEETEDTFIFLGARDLRRGEDAAKRLEQSSRVQVVELDVGIDESVKTAALHIKEACNGEPLYGIVNNAGVGESDDLPNILNVNARGIYRVCTALIPLLRDDGRVINVTSAAGPRFVSACSARYQQFFTYPNVSWNEIKALMNESEQLDREGLLSRGLGNGSFYGFSKACANALTIHLAREYPNLIIHACTPGFIATDITLRHEREQGKSLKEMGAKTPREGANSTLFLLFGEPKGSGHYYGSDAKRSPLDRYRSPGSPEYIEQDT
ncbi:MAG: SDR family NAD(P)-dependent oxidoreductase [Myxococcota bacterium]